MELLEQNIEHKYKPNLSFNLCRPSDYIKKNEINKTIITFKILNLAKLFRIIDKIKSKNIC